MQKNILSKSGTKKPSKKISPHTSTCRKATRHTLNKAQLTANNGKANTSFGKKKKTGKISVPKMGETLAQASAPLETVRGVFFFRS